MNQFKGTKGNWSLTKSPKAFAEVVGYPYFEISTDDKDYGKWVAQVLDNEDEQSEANAKLFAASKKMAFRLQDNHEMLLRCYSIISSECDDEEFLKELRTEMTNTLNLLNEAL